MAVALWDYEGETSAELSFKEGDILVLLEKLEEGGWWVGELNGRSGSFPKDYVRVCEPTYDATTPDPSHTPTILAQALYDYKAMTDSELSLTKGEEVVVLQKQVKGGWSKVSSSGRTGHVPLSYLRFTDELSLPKNQSPPSGKARALWAFDAKSATELSFNKGDEIIILKRLEGSWWLGEFNGCVGHFPKSYVQEEGAEELASDAVATPSNNDAVATSSTNIGAGETAATTTPGIFIFSSTGILLPHLICAYASQ